MKFGKLAHEIWQNGTKLQKNEKQLSLTSKGESKVKYKIKTEICKS